MRVKGAVRYFCWVLAFVAVAGTTAGVARPQDSTPGGATKKQGESTTPGQKQEQEKDKKKPVPDADADSPASSGYGLVTLGKDFLGDQKQIWTSPARLR